MRNLGSQDLKTAKPLPQPVISSPFVTVCITTRSGNFGHSLRFCPFCFVGPSLSLSTPLSTIHRQSLYFWEPRDRRHLIGLSTHPFRGSSPSRLTERRTSHLCARARETRRDRSELSQPKFVWCNGGESIPVASTAPPRFPRASEDTPLPSSQQSRPPVSMSRYSQFAVAVQNYLCSSLRVILTSLLFSPGVSARRSDLRASLAFSDIGHRRRYSYSSEDPCQLLP